MKKTKPQNRQQIVDDNTVFYVLRKNGFTKEQARKVNIVQSSSQGALDTLVNNHDNDASRYETVKDNDGVARTAIEISNPEATGGETKLLSVHYTTESRFGDLQRLVKTVAKTYDDLSDEWADMLKRKFGADSVRHKK